ncbi:MAG: phosphotransferase [Actinomycetota bacterium]
MLAVLIGLGAPSVGAVLFWLLVAGGFRTDAFIAAFAAATVVIALGELGAYALGRHRPPLGGHGTALLGPTWWRSATLIGAIVAVCAIVFVLGLDIWAPGLLAVRSAPLATLVVIVAVAWFALRAIELAVVAVVGSPWSWLARALLAFGRIALVVAFTLDDGLRGETLAILIWSLPVLAAVAAVGVPAFGLISDGGAPPDAVARGVIGVAPWPWLAHAARWAAIAVVTIVALGRLTALDAADYYVAWLVVGLATVIIEQLVSAVTTGVLRTDPSNDRAISRALLWSVLLAVGGILVVGVFGPLLIDVVVGEPGNAAALRWLGLVLVPRAVVATFVLRLLTESRTLVVTVLRVTMAVGTVVLALALVGSFEVMGLVLAWLVVEAVAAVAALGALTVWWWGARLSGPPAEIATRLTTLGRSLKARPERSERNRQVMVMLDGMYQTSPEWERVSATPTSQNLRVAGHEGRPPLLLELSRTPDGARLLEKRRTAVRDINRIPELHGLRSLVPFPIDHGDEPSPYLVESVVSGQPGSVAAGPELVRSRVEAITDVIVELHHATASTLVVDADLLDEWVATPLKRLGDAVRLPDGDLARVARIMFEGINGLSLAGARIHGDLRMDNALFDEGGSRLKGITGWEWSQSGPIALDWGVLALSAIMAEEERDLGPVVRDLLDEPARLRLHPAFVSAVGDAVPPKVLVMMSWLQYTRPEVLHAGTDGLSRFWQARNVEPVFQRLFDGP